MGILLPDSDARCASCKKPVPKCLDRIRAERWSRDDWHCGHPDTWHCADCDHLAQCPVCGTTDQYT